MERYITDIVEFTGKRPEPFEGMKKYISTGALILSNIDNNAVELIEYYSRPSRADLEVKPGDLVFAKMSNTDKRLIINEETSKYIYSTGFFAVKAKQGVITTKCLYYLLGSKNFLDQKDKNSTGATQRAITIDGLSKIKVRIPDYISQKNIEIILELLDEIVKLRKNQINEYDQLIKSRFVEMFGDPIINTKNFQTKKVINVVTLQRGYDLPIQNRNTKGKIPLYGANGQMDWHDISKSEKGIITGRSGSIGNVYYCESKFWPLNTTLFSKDTHGNEIIYLCYLMQFFDLKRFSNGTGVPTLNRNLFHNEQIIDAPIHLQKQFTAFVRQIDKLKFAVQKSLDETQKLFDSLMQEYFG